MKQIYQLTMRAPLGIRRGTLTLVENEKTGEISGILEILGHTSTCGGHREQDGNVRLNGTLTTMLSSIPYTATGQIDPQHLELHVVGGRYALDISGEGTQA